MKLVLRIILLFGITWSLHAGPFSTNAPSDWENRTSVDIFSFSHLALSNNTPDQIREELTNAEVIEMIAAWKHVSAAQMKNLRLVIGKGDELVSLYQVAGGDKTFTQMAEGLREYVKERNSGHSRSFVLSALKERSQHETVHDPDLKLFLNARPLLPASAVQKVGGGTVTNKAGTIRSISGSSDNVNGRLESVMMTNRLRSDEVCRWLLYRVVDGGVAWNYSVRFKPDGRFDDIFDSCEDAKEYDPKFRDIISKVEQEVDAEMKKAGMSGRLGAVHTFWRLKREKLKALGIPWRSPAELNPGTIFD